ncbi:LytTR family transcriptional regulator DNA-binding domain-containing protein [Planomicrobium sp. YIM 101495]|uniref:LytTR family transcriptional regulator DNA-binding domain-containing protein n=1 Tax=Planomicrobium sp. YIM 101495 TaxID=2665160 RepID=UPI0012BA1016|nr:LytTR family transcriptional regulator DNA-binding domain-containing protein [Planomicrobium sp. YIM 101495]MTD30601.1 ABC transporter ATP-binding protein [Planomicrobium sp. YIM 101495]
MTLIFNKAEKQFSDVIVFPAFDLTLTQGQTIAIHCSVNIRQQLMEILTCRSTLSAGDIKVSEKRLSKKMDLLGFLFLEGGMYERLTVGETLRFYHGLFTSGISPQHALELMQLEGRQRVKVMKLNHSEKKRLQMACILLKDPKVFILEEPDQNLDNESKRIYLHALEELQNHGKSILLLTGNLESAVTLGTKVYRLDDKGLQEMDVSEEQEEVQTEEKEVEQVSAQPIRFEKIPTRVNEKIVLFDPPEIDYIESTDGQSLLHIKGEAFPSFFTLTDLEERLLLFGFFRCHRSYIVNLQKVREVITWTKNSYSLVLDDANKTQIPLSKTKMASLKEMLGLK